jgi:hypothetical protein
VNTGDIINRRKKKGKKPGGDTLTMDKALKVDVAAEAHPGRTPGLAPSVGSVPLYESEGMLSLVPRLYPLSKGMG